MRNIGIFKHIDHLGRFKIPKELLDSYNLKPNSLIRIYQKEKNIILEAVNHHCIFCHSLNGIHKFEDKYICSNCIKKIKNKST